MNLKQIALASALTLSGITAGAAGAKAATAKSQPVEQTITHELKGDDYSKYVLPQVTASTPSKVQHASTDMDMEDRHYSITEGFDNFSKPVFFNVLDNNQKVYVVDKSIEKLNSIVDSEKEIDNLTNDIDAFNEKKTTQNLFKVFQDIEQNKYLKEVFEYALNHHKLIKDDFVLLTDNNDIIDLIHPIVPNEPDWESDDAKTLLAAIDFTNAIIKETSSEIKGTGDSKIQTDIAFLRTIKSICNGDFDNLNLSSDIANSVFSNLQKFGSFTTKEAFNEQVESAYEEIKTGVDGISSADKAKTRKVFDGKRIVIENPDGRYTVGGAKIK